jgi:hypothetical protein
MSRLPSFTSPHLLGLLLLLVVNGVTSASESYEGDTWVELSLSVPPETLERVLAVPQVRLAAGLSSRVLVPTRSGLFDPFDFFVVDNGRVWVADDGRNGAVFEVNLNGKVTLLADIQKHAPYAIDVAPADFGSHGGKIYAIAFARPEKAGGWELPNAITRIDPRTGADEVVCYLPENAERVPGAGGFFARFGPQGSPFAGRLWLTAASNHTIYTISPDDVCAPFKTLNLEREGSPRGIAFTPDGQSMLLGVTAPAEANRNVVHAGGGRVLRMSADGELAPQPVARGLHEPGAMAYAPVEFGRFGGALVISDAGEWNNDTVATEPVSRDGHIYRVMEDGSVESLVEGLANPVGVGFLGKQLVISDINGDFHVGTQKFADGFMLVITPE